MTVAIPKKKGLPLKVVKRPKVEKLTILLLHEAKPDGNGFWKFAPELPNEGMPPFRIVARDVRTAKGLLEAWIYNELAAEGLIEEEPE